MLFYMSLVESERLKGRNPGKLRKAIASAQEEMQIKKLVDFQKRQAKGKKKGKRPQPFEDDSAGNPNKIKKKSYFDDEITDVKNARAFRHQPKSFKGDGKPPNKSNNNKMGMGKKNDENKFSSKSPKNKGGTPRSNVNKSNRKFSQKLKNKAR